MASQNVETLFPVKDDHSVYLKQDPVNRMVEHTEKVFEELTDSSVEIGIQYRDFIRCAKFQDIGSNDLPQLVDAIDSFKVKLEKLQTYLFFIQSLVKSPPEWVYFGLRTDWKLFAPKIQNKIKSAPFFLFNFE